MANCYDTAEGCKENPVEVYYTKSEIDNLLNQVILLQNNFVRVIEVSLSDLSGVGTIKEQIRDFINTENQIIITQTDAKHNIHLLDYDEVYEIINLGKGTYGLNGVAITTANIFKISSSAESLVWVTIQDDVIAIPNTGYVTDSLTKVVIDLPTENSTFIIRAVGNWRINLPAGVVLHFVDEIIDNYIESIDLYTSIELLHINGEYKVISSVGNIQYFNQS